MFDYLQTGPTNRTYKQNLQTEPTQRGPTQSGPTCSRLCSSITIFTSRLCRVSKNALRCFLSVKK